MDDLAALAAAIVTELGDGWRPQPPSPRRMDGRELVHADGRRLLIRFTDSRRKVRVEVRGLFPFSPHGTPHGTSTPAITVAAGRGTPVIAREVRRRLLPTYTAVLNRVRVFQADRAREDARRHQLAHQIRSILPGVTDGYSRYGGHLPTHTTLNWSSRRASGTVTLTREADVTDLELRQIPRHTAVQICCLLAADLTGDGADAHEARQPC